MKTRGEMEAELSPANVKFEEDYLGYGPLDTVSSNSPLWKISRLSYQT